MFKKYKLIKRSILSLFFSIIISNHLYADINRFKHQQENDKAILIIGSSYANGTTRIDDHQSGSLLGLAVGSGAYLSLGDALVREKRLNGLVVNEASVGSTTFDRFSCLVNECLSTGQLLGYQKQFENALKRVAIYDPTIPNIITNYNAKYLIIGISNDCIHSDSFGIPQQNTSPCSIDDITAMTNRIIEVAKNAESLGLKVIIPILPKYKHLQLNLVQASLGLLWVADEYQYNQIRTTLKTKVEEELPNALSVNIWKKFTHRGDGIHPDRKTVKRAARKIARIIYKNNNINNGLFY